MATVLVCVLPARGHIGPTLPAVEALVGAGHEVRVLTGRRYLDRFRAAGAEVDRLPEESDFDDANLTASFPERAGLRGLRLARWDLTMFVTRMGPQLAAIDELVAAHSVDVVLCDPLLMAGLPLTVRDGGPPVLVLGFIPLSVPFPGLPPVPGVFGAARRRAVTALAHRVVAPVQVTAEREVRRLVGRPPARLFFDWPAGSAGVIQLSCTGFEHPRELPVPVDFVGPLSTSSTTEHPLPAWWADLDDGRPIILLTQGGVANTDLGDLVLPTLDALAGENLHIVVSTGGADLPVDRVPPNARVAAALPYDDVLPRCAVMVTNGGYGGVNHALRHGVPVVCVGASEDKRAVAERVSWSGVGIGLARQRISARRVGRVVRRVLADPRYAARAGTLAAQIAECPGGSGVVAAVERVHDTGDNGAGGHAT